MTPRRWYLVSFAAGEDNEFGIAYVINGPAEIGGERDWLMTHAPVRLNLKEGIVADYLQNDVGWALCSGKMRKVIDSVTDEVTWIEAVVLSRDEAIPYYILDCQFRPDVVDKRKSKFHGDVLIKRVFDAKALEAYNVFRCVDDIVGGLCVSEAVRQQLVDAECTGVEFDPLPVK